VVQGWCCTIYYCHQYLLNRPQLLVLLDYEIIQSWSSCDCAQVQQRPSCCEHKQEVLLSACYPTPDVCLPVQQQSVTSGAFNCTLTQMFLAPVVCLLLLLTGQLLEQHKQDTLLRTRGKDATILSYLSPQLLSVCCCCCPQVSYWSSTSRTLCSGPEVKRHTACRTSGPSSSTIRWSSSMATRASPLC
jgi:hypothetical protein